MIGSLKEEVLLAVARLGPRVISADVHDAINEARKSERGKGLSFAAVFNTLKRLTDDEMLDTGKSKTLHRGKPMVAYTINATGERALEEASAIRRHIAARKNRSELGGLAHA